MSLHEEEAQHEDRRWIRSTATQEVEAEGEDYVATREQLLASMPEGFERLHVRRGSWTVAPSPWCPRGCRRPCRLLVGGGELLSAWPLLIFSSQSSINAIYSIQLMD